MKNKILTLVFAVLMAGLSGCGGGSNPVVPTVTTNTVAGSAVKGPYQVGAVVKVYELTNGVRGATPVVEGTITDALGTYSVDIPSTATGPFEIVVLGSYIDETTGALSTTDQETSLVIADAANVPAKLSVNPIASIQAAIVKEALVANNGADVAATIQSSGTLALEAMGIPTVDVNGNAVDPVQLDLFDTTADPAVVAAFLTASAIVADVVNNGNGTVADFATNAATDVAAGNALGTAGGTTAAITTAATNVAAIDLVANVAAAVTAADPTVTATVATTAAAVTTATTTAATLTTLKGFVLSGNSFSVGGVAASVDAYGVAAAITGVAKNAVSVAMTVKDLGTGTAPNASSASTSFDFYVKDTATTRMIKGTINPVKLVADGTGIVTFTVPAAATLAWSGVTAAGTSIAAATATNLAANTIFNTDAAGVTTIDVNALLTLLQNKVNNADLNVLNIAGTFDYALGFGVNLGWANTTNDGIMNLFPTGNANVTGRAISGTITTQ
ncbi:MAG: hypothetical protein Q9N67_03995 [Ghiorsea sp.]|nr:hypothetical protein [Ghiorsea sp.]